MGDTGLECGVYTSEAAAQSPREMEFDHRFNASPRQLFPEAVPFALSP